MGLNFSGEFVIVAQSFLSLFQLSGYVHDHRDGND